MEVINRTEEREILEKVAKRRGCAHKILAEDIMQYGVLYHVRKPYTFVRINSPEPENQLDSQATIIGVGFSKCSPRDKFDNKIGERIAFTRAAAEYVDNLYAASRKK